VARHAEVTEAMADLLGLPGPSGYARTSPLYSYTSFLVSNKVIPPIIARPFTPRDATAILLSAIGFIGTVGNKVRDEVPILLNIPLSKAFRSKLFLSVPVCAPLDDKGLTLGSALDRIIELASSPLLIDQMGRLPLKQIKEARLPLPMLMESNEIGFTFHLYKPTRQAMIRLAVGPSDADCILILEFAYPSDSEHATVPPASRVDVSVVGTAFFYTLASIFKEPPPRDAIPDRRPVLSLGDMLRVATIHTRMKVKS